MFYLNNEKIEVSKVIELFGVPMPDTAIAVMELDPSQVRPDLINGGIKHTVERRFKTTFRSTYPETGEDMEISYSESTPIKDLQGRTKYFPRQLSFEGHKMMFDMATKKEKYVYFWLNPRCGESPFNKGKEKQWNIFNPETIAIKDWDKESAIADCIVLIKDFSFDQLVHKSKGMNLATFEKKESELKTALASRAKLDPAKFIKEITSETIEWKGNIRDAIDKGIFVQRYLGGTNRWFWEAGAKKGSEICLIDKGADAFDVLLTKMVEDIPFYRAELQRIGSEASVARKLDKALKEEKEEENTPKPELTDGTTNQGVDGVESKIMTAIKHLDAKGFFDIEEKTKLVRFGKKKIADVCYINSDNWMDDVEAACNNKPAIKSKIGGTYNLVKNKG